MILFRSLLFHILFYLNIVLQIFLWLPLYCLLPRKHALLIPKIWARSSLWLHDRIIGTQCRFIGFENIPKGSFIIASKHQSFWDTFAMFPFFDDPLFILKKSLFRIPFFGFYIKKMRFIGVSKNHSFKSLKQVIAAAKKELALHTRQIIIYPEGTRTIPGADPDYKRGVWKLYKELCLPIVPVAHQAGLFWPRRRFLHFPGIIRVQFLPPIDPGLSEKDFMERLICSIEGASDEILYQTAQDPIFPPVSKKTEEKLEKLRILKHAR